MNDQELERIVRSVLARLEEHGVTREPRGAELETGREAEPRCALSTEQVSATEAERGERIEPGAIEDIGSVDLRSVYLVEHPHDKEAFMEMKLRTPARLGAGRAGARNRTETMLRFQADHAAAQDAVFSDVPEDFLKALSMPVYQTRCRDRDEFLTRPDKGRVFAPETLESIRASINGECRVLLYVADGLSSSAVTANARDILPVIREGLRGYGISCNEPFFVKYGRVGTMDALGDVISADAVCLLIGERPGLVTADGMSAYMAYRPRSGMPESGRTVLANIHSGGTPSVEAGAHIVDLLRLILDKKASGVDLPV